MLFFGFPFCAGFSDDNFGVTTSKDFEHPAWVQVTPSSISSWIPPEMQFPTKMAVRASVSPSGRWLTIGTVNYSKPVLGESDGYSMLDRRGLEGGFDLCLYTRKAAVYAKAKNFPFHASWRSQSWSFNERFSALIGGSGMMIIEKLGSDRVFILDTEKKSLKQIFSAPNVDEVRISDDGKKVSIVKSEFHSEKVTRTKVVVSQSGRILSKEVMADHF